MGRQKNSRDNNSELSEDRSENWTSIQSFRFTAERAKEEGAKFFDSQFVE